MFIKDERTYISCKVSFGAWENHALLTENHEIIVNIHCTCMPSPKRQLVLCSKILEAGACDRDIRVWIHGHMVVAFWACYLHCLRDRKQCVSLFRTTMRTPHIHVHKRGIGSANCTIRLYEHFYNRACQ